MENKICTKCNTEILGDKQHCGECGYPIGWENNSKCKICNLDINETNNHTSCAEYIIKKEGMIPVKSSNIEGYIYDSVNKIFTIYFLNGSSYQYENVPPVNIELFSIAESKGKFFIEHIRNQFKTTKLREANKKEKTVK